MISSLLKPLFQRLGVLVHPLTSRLFPPPRILPSPTGALALLSLKQVRSENRFAFHLVSWAAISFLLIGGNLSDGSDELWSPWPVGFWAVAVAFHGRRALITRRRRYEAEHHRLREEGASDGETDVGRLRLKLLRTAEEARETLRSASPEMAAEISRGETEALAVVAWLDEAERLLAGGKVDSDLRRQAARRLSEPGHDSRDELELLVAELDRNDGRRAALEGEATERRANVESFLLATENLRLAHGGSAEGGGDVASAVEASIRERVALLAEPRAGTRLRQEVQLAQDLQRSILPAAAPTVAGLEVAHVYRPSSEVGGDFYDFYATDSGNLLIALGDASGHGLDSSMVSSMAKSALYMQVSSRSALDETMAELNRMMCDTLDRRRLMTFTLLELDPGRRRVSWVNAGQVYPLLRRGGELIELEQPGYPLGVRRKTRYEILDLDLEPGDLLLLLTDGYVEAADATGEPYGWERLADRLRKLPGGDPHRVLESLGADLDRYLEATPPQDDFTLIALAFEP